MLDAEFQPRTVTLPDLDGAGELPVARLSWMPRRADHRGTGLGPSAHRVHLGHPRRDTCGVESRPRVGARLCHLDRDPARTAGLVVFESADPAAKPLVAEVFARELSAPGRTAALAAAAGEELAARGHAPQVVPQPDSVSLFSLEPVRRSIRRQGDRLAIGDDTHSSEELARAARERPAAFSPNVLLRPIVQDTLFPTICYVAGPSELAYLGQLRGALRAVRRADAADVPALDGDAARFRRGALPRQVQHPVRGTAHARRIDAQQAARGAAAGRVEQSLKDAASQVHDAMGRVIEALPALDPTLQGAAKTTLGKMEHELRALALEGDPRGEEARRDAAPAVHPRAGAGLPARPSTGAHARR